MQTINQRTWFLEIGFGLNFICGYSGFVQLLCFSVDGIWSEWTTTGSSSVFVDGPLYKTFLVLANCSADRTTRTRECTNPPAVYFGAECAGLSCMSINQNISFYQQYPVVMS